MKTFNLIPTNGRKSFGGKCRVEQDGDISYLYSFNKKVAHYNHTTNKMVVNGWYSATTATHINSFLEYYGFDTCSKKDLNDYSSI